MCLFHYKKFNYNPAILQIFNLLLWIIANSDIDLLKFMVTRLINPFNKYNIDKNITSKIYIKECTHMYFLFYLE